MGSGNKVLFFQACPYIRNSTLFCSRSQIRWYRGVQGLCRVRALYPPSFYRDGVCICTEEPHAVIWQVPVSSNQNKKYPLCFLNTKQVDDMCFAPGCHKLTFTVWQTKLVLFTSMTLVLCHPGDVPSFSAPCCVSTEICAPLSIRNFTSSCQGSTGIRMYSA